MPQRQSSSSERPSHRAHLTRPQEVAERSYITEVLHLSDAEAYLRIAAARASREHPALLTLLADGRLHLTAIAKLAPHLTPENREALLERAVYRSKRQIEELVGGGVAPPGCSGAAIIEQAITEKLQRLEARRFARTQTPRKTLSDSDTSPTARQIPAAVRRAVYERDGGRCRYEDTQGRRCTARQGLEFHHRLPFGHGGDHSVVNVALACRSHNGYLAEVDYGREAVARHRRSGDPSRGTGAVSLTVTTAGRGRVGSCRRGADQPPSSLRPGRAAGSSHELPVLVDELPVLLMGCCKPRAPGAGLQT